MIVCSKSTCESLNFMYVVASCVIVLIVFQFEEKLNYMLSHLQAATKSSPKTSKKRLPNDAPSAINAFFAAAERSEASMAAVIEECDEQKKESKDDEVKESKDYEVKEGTKERRKPLAAPLSAAKKVPPQLRVYSEPVIQPPTAPKKKKLDAPKPLSSDVSSSVDSSIPQGIERKLDSVTRSALSKSQHLIQETLSLTSKRKKKKGKRRSVPHEDTAGSDTGEDVGASSDESLPKARPATTLPQVKPPKQIVRTVTFSGPIGLKQEESDHRMYAVASAPNLHRKRSKGDTFPTLNIEGAVDVLDETMPRSPAKFVHSTEAPKTFLDNRAWENDIARHILSIYASTKMHDDPKASAVLEVVETDAGSSKHLLQEGILHQKKSDINFNKTPRRASVTQRKTSKTDRRKLSQSSLDAPLNAGISGLPKSKKLDYKEREIINTTVRATQTPRVVRAPPKCFPIWFVSSGDDIYAEWLSLPGKEQLQGVLDRLREKKQYKEYVDIVENILSTLLVNILYREEKERERIARAQEIVYTGSPKASAKMATDALSIKSSDTRTDGSDVVELTKEEISVLWRQLVLVSNAFAILYLENKQMDLCMHVIQQAESWCTRDDIFPAEMRAELKSYVHNTMAYYFYRKKMTRATLNHTKQAMMYYKKVRNYEYVALCLLHQSCAEYQMSNFKGALQVNI